MRKNTETESKKNSSTLGVIGVVGRRGVVERGGVGEGREVKGNGHSSSPLSMRIDLEKISSRCTL